MFKPSVNYLNDVWYSYYLFGCLVSGLMLGLQLWVYLEISSSCASFNDSEMCPIWGTYWFSVNLSFSVIPMLIGSFGKFTPIFISYSWQLRNFPWCFNRPIFFILILSFTMWFVFLAIDVQLGTSSYMSPSLPNSELWVAFSSCLKFFGSWFTNWCYFFKTIQSLFRTAEYLVATFLFVNKLQSVVFTLVSANNVRIYFFLAYLLFNLLISICN